jgi:integrase
MAKVLTTAAVAKYVPRPQRREIPDAKARGLYLCIFPSGVKSWVLRFRRPDGRPAKLTLGAVSDEESADEPELGAPLTLGMARELAARINRQRARGIDVIEENKARKHRKRAAAFQNATNSFGAAVREFFVDHKTRKWFTRPRRWGGDARLLGLDWPRGCDPAATEPRVIPGGLAATWADKPVADIDGHDIHAIVDEARKFGIPGLPRHNQGVSEARGRKMHSALSVLFRWLLQRRRVTVNPCVGVWHPGAGPARERVLADAEVRLFWRGCERLGPPYGVLFKLLLLTGCRLNEVTGMTRAELSEDGATWTIPSQRTKNHRRHVVPLPALARDILAAVPRIESAAGYLFTLSGARPVTSFSGAKAQLDAAMLTVAREEAEVAGRDPAAINGPWRLHDLRRTAATGMAELGIAPHIVEACLNHVSGAKAAVAGVYNRAAYAPEKAAALARWANHIAGLVSGQAATVTPIRSRGA